MSFATQQQQQQQQQLHNGMKPNFYNQHSSTQGNAVELCRHLLLQAAQQMPLPTETVAVPDDADPLLKAPPASSCCCINVAEWGCSHGGNSIAPVVLIAEVLQQRLAGACGSTRAAEQATQGSTDTAAAAAAMKTAAEAAELPPQQQQQQQQEVHISHVDVPNNDFSSLFACTQQYSAAIQHACPLLHVTSSAVGGSMYARNFPRRSLNLGFSFSTLHWQSSRAVRLSGTVSPGCSKTLPEEHTVLREHAMADLARFLALRAQELRPGGLLLLCYPGCSDDAPLQSMAFHDAAQAVAEGMVADGLLQQEDLGSMAAPVYFLDEPVSGRCMPLWLTPGSCSPSTSSTTCHQAGRSSGRDAPATSSKQRCLSISGGGGGAIHARRAIEANSRTRCTRCCCSA
ncbi:S-adenosyl-L-methionine-dependent methyltransferase [Scenedesmus sp. NREL 46B-D3]|nr:S-adenosyl-L-methionine-dependent methyltransferase [Scenedesmus sp. NREL 46B-D3]